MKSPARSQAKSQGKLQSRAARERLKQAIADLNDLRKFQYRPALMRKSRLRDARARTLISYDLETTSIAAGTPRPLYITAYHPRLLHYEKPLVSFQDLHQSLVSNFLINDFIDCRFVAWNGNRFDAYMIALALIDDERFIMRPFLTRNKMLRGLSVIRAEDDGKKRAKGWMFLDGIAMLGLPGVSLEKLAQTFAPDLPKLKDVIDFDKEQFDSSNALHRTYAMRDSITLWHCMDRAQTILLETFNEPIAVTMGGACIKIFQAHIPQVAQIDALIPDLESIVNRYVMRGGYCHCVKRFKGPIWKYDLNQAYVAAMRDAKLPAGAVVRGNGEPPAGGVFVVRITAKHATNEIPFYSRCEINGRLRIRFDKRAIAETWITSNEYDQLKREGWEVNCFEFYAWCSNFNMADYVNKLERIRQTCEGGPKGAVGTMIKAVGNHSYGKTLETIDPIEYLIAAECPADCVPFYADPEDADPVDHIYWRPDPNRKRKDYHQPHVGAFITAYVRMQVRRAALIAPDAWLYADTDCVVFSRDVTVQMDIDAARYGAWKVEESGTDYLVIAKKVYTSLDGSTRSAKGMNVKRLSTSDFENWHEGNAPVQQQIQVQNFLAVMRGLDMFRAQTRTGTRTTLDTSSATM